MTRRGAATQILSCQYMYFCTGKARKLSTKQIALCHDEVLRFEVAVDDANGVQARQCQQHVPHDVDGKVDLSSAAGYIFRECQQCQHCQQRMPHDVDGEVDLDVRELARRQLDWR